LYKRGTLDFNNLMLTTGYKVGDAYANSKLAAVVDTLQLAEHTRDKGITVNALHPGMLGTSVFRDYPKLVAKLLNLFLEKPRKGGARIAYLATSEKVAGVSGRYFNKTEVQEIDTSKFVEEAPEKLWTVARELTGLSM
jgi:NAD(P)-dependent dehydrogenase (short-subunit alcohol dehydrogenase family)